MKKGFTLIELLAVIVILAIVAVIAVPSIIKIINNAKESVIERQKEFVMDAAKFYAAKNPDAETVTVQQLIDNNYLKEITNKELLGYAVDLKSKKLVQLSNYSGTSINISNTLEAPIGRIRIHGKTKEGGTGEKAPNNPYNLNSLNIFDLVVRSGYKSETPYTSNTWAEWEKPSYVSADVTGLEFTASYYGDTYLPGNFKPSTQYGVLLNVVSSTLNQSYSFYVGGNNSAFPDVLMPASNNVGNKKIIVTSRPTITINKFKFWVNYGNETPTNKIKVKDVRVFELPPNSQIKNDFDSLSANELASKYPFVGKEETKEQVISISLAQPLRSLPEGPTDYIEIDNIAKQARLVQNVGIVTFDGSSDEGWTRGADVYDNVWRFSLKFTDNLSVAIPICTHFKPYLDANLVANLEGIATRGGNYNFNLQILKSRVATNIREWLAVNPITIQYKLTEPVIIPLDYNAYKNISTYKAVTSIFKTGEFSNIDAWVYSK